MEEPGTSEGRWTKSRARELLKEWAGQGGSLSAFARERGIGLRRLYWWRQRRARQGRFVRRGARATAVDESTLKFAPAVLVPAPPSASPVVVRIGTSLAIEVHALDAASASWVAALARELASGM
jgi:hypothetical protein